MPMTLSSEERQTLLALARETVERAAHDRTLPTLPPATGSLALCAGAFVSLHLLGPRGPELRGCIGSFDTSSPLLEVVRSMAEAAARRDPRFRPLRPPELASLKVSISVLDVPSAVGELDEIVLGQHGLLISQGYSRGVFLAKVAVEQGWSRDEFLDHLCLKAGLPRKQWQRFGEDAGLVLEKFEEFDFEESHTA